MICNHRICEYVMLCNEVESTHECLYKQFQKAQLMGMCEAVEIMKYHVDSYDGAYHAIDEIDEKIEEIRRELCS